MRIQLIFSLFLSIMLVSVEISAEIIEFAHFKEVYQYVKEEEDVLLLLDIDDTLLIPKQMLGTDAWFSYRMEERIRDGVLQDEALEITLAEWEAVRHLTKIEVVEKGTEKIIGNLQKQGLKVMGLTTQGLALTTRTIQQLNSLYIDLSLTAPSCQEYYFQNGQGVLYRQGILFTSGTKKGKALLKFLDLAGYYPKLVVFINDKWAHLRDVERSVEEKGIKFIGLRYSFSDERVKSFNPKITEIQWKNSSFEHILTDEEANLYLKEESDCSKSNCLIE